MSARLLTVNDLYSFDPNVQVELEEFTDIVGRNFRQPEEGLGFDQARRRTCGGRSTGRRGTCRPFRPGRTRSADRRSSAPTAERVQSRVSHRADSPVAVVLRPTVVEASPARLAGNLRAIQAAVAPAAVMPIVKANAYGHGLVEVARHLVGPRGGIAGRGLPRRGRGASRGRASHCPSWSRAAFSGIRPACSCAMGSPSPRRRSTSSGRSTRPRGTWT